MQPAAAPADENTLPLDLLRCPRSGQALVRDGDALVTADGAGNYEVSPEGIPLFATQFLSDAGRQQQAHYDRIAASYVENLGYPHTQEYMKYLDDVLLAVVDRSRLGTVAEICCGRGEAFHLIGGDVERGVGVDVSLQMLRAALHDRADGGSRLSFVQGDATMLPLASNSFDNVFALGGIHHVQDRTRFFSEVARILKPGGRFIFREPVSDFILWRALRAIVYRLSPALDHDTERPLLHEETVPVFERAGLINRHWSTHGFLGFCFLMNSDVLVFNRLFRFIPGIRAMTRVAARFDEWVTHLPGLRRAGLQVVGVAEKPA
jgi:SAM-dependent methyltransferase